MDRGRNAILPCALIGAAIVAVLGGLLSVTPILPAAATAAEQHATNTITPTLTSAPTPTSTPSALPTRSIGWFSHAAKQIPKDLPRTVVFSSAGGAGGSVPNELCDAFVALCGRILTLPGTQAWVVYPQSNTIILGGRYDAGATIGVTACRTEVGIAAQVALTDPNGRVMPTAVPGEESDNTPDFEPCRWSQPASVYDLADGSQPGTYTLSVQRSSAVMTATWQVEYPRSSISINEVWLSGGSDLEILYRDFRRFAGQGLTVGLYRKNECRRTSDLFEEVTAADDAFYSLVDTWVVPLDSQGDYTETSVVPEDAPQGTYLVAACTTPSCEAQEVLSTFMGKERGYGSDLEISVPFVFHSVERRRVDAVAAWNGLALRVGPGRGAPALGTLPPDGIVTVLDGTAKADGTKWWWVQNDNDASGERGWVDEGYLFDVSCSAWDLYASLAWVPVCDPQRPEVALLREDQHACDPDVKTEDLAWLRGELISVGLVDRSEQLVAISEGGRPNQGVAIESAAGERVGFVRFGGPAPVSGVWRITTSAPHQQLGKRCWLRRDRNWRCE